MFKPDIWLKAQQTSLEVVNLFQEEKKKILKDIKLSIKQIAV